MQFLKQTFEEQLFAAYILHVKTHSVLAVGESYCGALQKEGGGLDPVRCAILHINLQVTAVPVSEGCGRQLDT